MNGVLFTLANRLQMKQSIDLCFLKEVCIYVSVCMCMVVCMCLPACACVRCERTYLGVSAWLDV